jgi:hypothetical protein
MNKELQSLICSTPQEGIKVDVALRDKTISLTQKAMATFFDIQVPAISKHLKNIFEKSELDENVVISKMETTTKHGAISDKTQKIISDFDKTIKTLEKKGGKS